MLYNALVLGSTGLIGSTLIDSLLRDDRYANIYAIVRRGGSIPLHPKLTEIIADFESIEYVGKKLNINHIYCCIGSTKRKTPNLLDYYKVDHDYPLRVAKVFPCDTFTYISSLGADATSNNSYLKLKGQTEQDLQLLNIPQLNILRPSLLLGKRKESRFLEDFAQQLFSWMNVLFVGYLKKFRAVPAVDVARAMITCTFAVHAGVRIIESEEIKKLT